MDNVELLSRNIVDFSHDTEFRNTPIADERTLAEYLERRMQELVEERRPWDWVWSEIRRLVLPERQVIQGFYDQSVSSSYSSPREYLQSISTEIYDMTAQQAIHTLTAGMQGYVLNQSAPWFAHTLAKERMRDLPGVMQYLSEIDEQLLSALNRSNFYSEAGPLIMDCAALGTGSLYYEPDAGDSYVFRSISMNELYIAEDAQRRVDTVYRVMQLTKRQAIQRFGYERLSDRIKQTNDDSIQFNVLHAVFPREDARDQEIGLIRRAPRSLLAMDAPYISVWKELSGPGGLGPWNTDQQSPGADELKILGYGGYRHFPYACWRWQLVTSSPYAIGPTQTIMPQVYQAQFFGRMLANSAQLHVQPSFTIPTSVQGEPDLTPGGYTFLANPTDRIEAVQRTGGNYPIGVDREERISKGIRDYYGVDYFMLITGGTGSEGISRTATEILAKESEKAAVLNSMMGRQGHDVHKPALTYLYYRELAAGRMPDRPPALDEYAGTDDDKLQLEYISPLALAQRRLAHMIGPLRAFESLIPVIQLYPPALDALKLPEFIRRLALAGGINPKDVRTIAEMEQYQHASAQRVEKQDQLEAAEQMARATRNANIDMSAGNQAQAGQQIMSLMQASA